MRISDNALKLFAGGLQIIENEYLFTGYLNNVFMPADVSEVQIYIYALR